MTHHLGTGGVLQHHRGLVAYFVHHAMNSSAPTTRARVGCFSIMIRDWWLCSPCHGQHITHHVGTGGVLQHHHGLVARFVHHVMNSSAPSTQLPAGYFSIITDWWFCPPSHGLNNTQHRTTGWILQHHPGLVALSTKSWTEQHPAYSYRLDTSASSRTGGFVHHVMNSTRPNTGARNDDCRASRGTIDALKGVWWWL